MRRFERFLLIVIAVAVAFLLLADPRLGEARAGADPDKNHTIAVCAVPSLVNELMASDRFLPLRENLLPDVRERMEELREEMAEIRDEFEGSNQNDDNAQDGVRRWRELQSELQAAQVQLSQAFEVTMAAQIGECYQLAKSSADAIAEDLGFDYVISTGDPDEDLNNTSTEAILRQITARPVVRYPKSTDITDDVREDLNLD